MPAGSHDHPDKIRFLLALENYLDTRDLLKTALEVRAANRSNLEYIKRVSTPPMDDSDYAKELALKSDAKYVAAYEDALQNVEKMIGDAKSKQSDADTRLLDAIDHMLAK
jgi:hypothetical protein